MKTSEKYILLASLSFFFGSLAVGLMSFHGSQPRTSYMYTPQIAEAGISQPLQESKKRHGVVAKSVMKYPGLEQTGQANTITCYLEDRYRALLQEKAEDNAITLAAQAQMGADQLEIFTTPDGQFSAFVIGPDNIGQIEACEVARGTGWRVIDR